MLRVVQHLLDADGLQGLAEGADGAVVMARDLLAWTADTSVHAEDLLGKPRGSWMGAAAVRSIAGQMREREGAAFERICDPYLNFLLGMTVRTTPQGPIDRCGGDFARWSGTERRPSLLVQCKGFRVLEKEVGADQLKQVERSVDALRQSELRPQSYVLLHNRDLDHGGTRSAMDELVQSLVRDGIVDTAVVWDRKQLLRRVMAKLFTFVQEVSATESARLAHQLLALGNGPLEKSVAVSIGGVDFRTSEGPELELDEPSLRDPVRELRTLGGAVALVLGGFGQGKTLLAVRATLEQHRNVVLLPAARLQAGATNTADVLRALQVHDQVTAMLTNAGLHQLVELVRVAEEHLLQQQHEHVPTLVVDGLDEASMAYRRNGIMTLLNTVSELHCPVVVTMRTEFWRVKQAEFAAGVHQLDRAAGLSTVPVLELQPWTPEFAAQHVRSISAEGEHAARLESLARQVDRAETDSFAGILLRPLFLSMAIDIALTEEVAAHSRPELVLQWTTAKVTRDVMRPQLWGEGRPGILEVNEDLQVTVDESHRLGKIAARLMVERVEDVLRPTDAVDWQKLRDAAGLSRAASMAAVISQTLLQPRSNDDYHRLAFAHRAIQEFYLAWALIEDPTREEVAPEVQDWVDEMVGSRGFW